MVRCQKLARTVLSRAALFVSLVSLFAPSSSFAQSGGLFLPENGAGSNGTAQAGSGAIARDAETSYLNPAGMTRLDSTELIVALMPLNMKYQFNPGPETSINGTDGGNQGGWLAGGGVFFATPVSEEISLGLSLTSPSGLILDPSDDWVGRSYMTKASLIALNIQPSVGWRLHETFSLGLGLDIQYLRFEQELVGPQGNLQVGIDGDSWMVGASPSLLWEPAEATRIGLRYRSSIAHDLSGDLTIVGTQSVSTSFTMPMSVTLSAFHEFESSWALMADLGWTDWSAFDYNQITFDNADNPIQVARNFVDTWSFSVGAHMTPSPQWLLMVGGGYVSTAVEDENRTPDLPVDEQARFAVGGEYQINVRWNVGVNYTYAWLGNNAIDQTRLINRRIKGDNDANVHLVGIYGALRF